MAIRQLTCIGCPLGCYIRVEQNDKEIISITGNTCKRGEDYARKEVTHPTRIITSCIPVSGGHLPVVSVKTASDVPKESIPDVMTCINKIRASAPVHIGDVLLKDVAGTNVDIIATKEIYVH